MTIAKIRNLSQYGIITDVDPYDLPPTAFSFGYNVRFRNGRVSRAPVFRTALALGTTSPRFVYSSTPTAGVDLTFIGYLNGTIVKSTPSSETDYSITAYAPSSTEAIWTGANLADVIYINRTDRVPWFLDPSSSIFQELTNWDSTWRAGLIRSCGGALVALNVTKGATSYPTMVKTSGFPTSGVVPSSWDHTDPSTNATENILAELEGAIVDAQNFGNNLIIYGHNSAWLMQKVDGFELFDYFKLPFQKGAINANCSVEIDGKHYVFGPNDIWVHDSNSEKSICEGRNRDFIYSTMNASESSKFFAAHNPVLKEIAFCYVSGDDGVNFVNATGCNRQAVYNYVNDTWSFDDLPSVYSAAYSNLSTSITWTNITGSWVTAGGSWLDLEDGFKRTPVYVGDTVAEYSLVDTLYAFDLYGTGSTVSFAVDTNATKGIYLERDGIDLDQFDDVNLSDYKVVKAIYPQARLDENANTDLSIEFGSADYYGQAATFDGTAQTYDNSTNYKLDYNMAGRYLSMKLTYDDYTSFSLSGFDIDIDKNGSR